MIRLSESGIEYLDYVWNFYSGCNNWRLANRCEVSEDCWARGTTNRFKSHYPHGFEPTFYPDAFLSPLDLKKPSIIGVAFMGDLFGDWVDPDMVISLPDSHGRTFANMALKELVFTIIKVCPQHTFVFLTKCPWNLPLWNPFPDNCIVGTTVCTDYKYSIAAEYMARVEAKVRCLSFEPLLSDIWAPHLVKVADWFVIGSYQLRSYQSLKARADDYHISQDQIMSYKSNYTLQPEMEWVKRLVDAADAAGIKVFLKDNLAPLVIPKFKEAPALYSNLMAKAGKGVLTSRRTVGVITGGLRQEVLCRK